jgi:hypothetical protein
MSTTAPKNESTAMQAPASAPIKGPRRASDILAEHLGLDPAGMIAAIKAQAFKSVPPNLVTNEALAIYINVARALTEAAPRFNPLLPGMLYAFQAKNGGIETMIGPDGIYALLASRDDIEGWNVTPEFDQAGKLVSCYSEIFVKGKRPFTKRCYLREWKINSNPNWNQRETHMLETRTLKQNARQVIHGLPMDAEELAVVEVEAKIIETPTASRSASLAHRIAPIVPAAPTASEPEDAGQTGEREQLEEPPAEPPRKPAKKGAKPAESGIAAEIEAAPVDMLIDSLLSFCASHASAISTAERPVNELDAWDRLGLPPHNPGEYLDKDSNGDSQIPRDASELREAAKALAGKHDGFRLNRKGGA